MVIGDMKKYLSVILTLKHDTEKDGSIKKTLANDVIAEFKKIGSAAKTVAEVNQDAKVKNYIEEGMKRVNA